MTEYEGHFLDSLRQQPNADFAADLYQRLVNQERRRSARSRRVAVTLLTTCLVFSLIFAASPEVRAQVDAIVQRVTVLYFGDVELRAVNGTINGTESEIPVPTADVPLIDAQAIIPFRLPVWVPDDFEQEPNVRVVYYSDTETGIGIHWNNPDGRKITLSIMNTGHPRPVVGGSHAGHEVAIGNETGLVYVGSWDMTTRQFGGEQLNVVWASNGVSYYLSADGVAEADLVRMAASQQ